MKIGVYLDSYRPEDGGAYTMQADILGALCKLADKSSHTFVLVSAPDKEIETQVRNAGLSWLPYRGLNLGEKIRGSLVRGFPSLRGRLRRQSAIEFQLRKVGVEFVWFLGPRPLEIDLPYLTIVLDLQHRKQPWFPEVSENIEWDTRERRLTPFLRRAAAIIAGTQAGKEEVIQFLQVPAERIHILPHPTPSYALEAKPSKLNIAGLQPGYLFYPAQFWAHKNHANLLLALKQLRDKGLQIPLVLAGSDYGNKEHVENMITGLKLTDQVRLLGFVDATQLVALYQNALALTYVSFFGPENLPPLEAFALGCPVIAAKVDGAEEQFGDAALLVDPASPEEIAAATRNMYEDKGLRAKLTARGKKRAGEWTAEDFVRGVFEILDRFEPIRRTWKS
ncbi:MAG: glycosyltransferase family 1 protein [Anaerolineales bacterium]